MDFKSIRIKFKVLSLFFEAPFGLDPGYIKYLLRFGKAQQHLPQVQGFLSQENTAVPGAGCKFPHELGTEYTTDFLIYSKVKAGFPLFLHS